MGKNKLYKFAQLETYPNVFQVSFNEYNKEDFKLKGKWHSHFKNDNPIVLEIGCGKGEYTVGLGELYPDKNFIGVDIKGARIYTGATDALSKKLDNVAFIRTKVELLDCFFNNNEVSEIWITFPDPQMKKTTKRLTSSRYLHLYNNILKENGIIHLKTDSNFLYTYTEILLKDNNVNTIINTNDLYNSGFVNNDLSIKTFYENQFFSQGIPIKYIKFTLPENIVLKEPDVEIEFDSYRSYGRDKKLREQKKTNKSKAENNK